MLFQSYIFIFLFFPIVFACYYGLNHFKQFNLAKILLIIASFIFYGYAGKQYMIMLGGSILLNFGVAILLKKVQMKTKADGLELKNKYTKRVLILGIAINLCILFYYKYYGFFLSNMNSFFGQSYTLHHILLPLGVSFFTFQQISMITDSYRGEFSNDSFIDYALYISNFSHLLSGPITLAGEMIPQYQEESRKKIDFDYIRQGLILFSIGLFKKIILADSFAAGADWGYGNIASLDTVNAILTTLFFAFQVYFDFSGYSDMARGVGKLFHFDLPVNFDSPFKASSYGEFWRRWHMTLYRFMMRYVYIPLGGSRRGKLRKAMNTMLVFIISGFWHGAQWTYFAWGTANGLFILGLDKLKTHVVKIPTVVNRFFILITFAFTTIFFRISRLRDVDDLLRCFGNFKGFKIHEKLIDGFNLDEFWYILKVLRIDTLPYSEMYLSIVVTIGSLLMVLFAKNSNEISENKNLSMLSAGFYAIVMVWCVVSLSAVKSFLYFNF